MEWKVSGALSDGISDQTLPITSRAEGSVKLNRSLDDLNITFFCYFYL